MNFTDAPTGKKYWEMIADSLHRAGWSYGVVGFWTKDGRRMHCVDLFAAFLELEASCRKQN